METRSLSRILYVEDDPDIQELARIALTTFGGYTVELVGRGDKALETARVFQPDLILLDMQLPQMSGLEILNQLKRDDEPLRRVPVILLTADKKQQRLIRTKDHPAAGLILKPFTPTQLIAKIKQIWAQTTGGSGRGEG